MILDTILHVSRRVALLAAVLIGLAATLGGCASLPKDCGIRTWGTGQGATFCTPGGSGYYNGFDLPTDYSHLVPGNSHR